jgi:hypothetical protein
MPKSTPEQKFAKIFARFTSGSTEHERATGERQMDRWLKDHGKTRGDIQALLAKAYADDLKQQPPSPPSDPRDDAPHPFDDPKFTPAGLVEGIAKKYVTMSEHVSVIYSLWVPFTHIYPEFAIAPRLALVSEDPDSGKSTLRKVARHLVYRPNREVLGTPAALERTLTGEPCTLLLDEVDHVRETARQRLLLIWNIGHERGAEISFMEAGRVKYLSIHAPILAAGISGFLAPTQKSRTLILDMEPYTEETKPERDYNTDLNTEEFDAVYSFLHHWAQKVKLNPKPLMPAGVIRRFADNARGLLSIADSCGPEWSRRAREAMTFLLAKEKSERPEITMVRHGLVIFEALGLDQIGSVRFNKELRRLDLPDAKWTRYRGSSGGEYAHLLEMHEQSALLGKVDIHSTQIRPPGEEQCRGYKLAQFQEAQRKYGVVAPDETEVGRARLRLVGPPD